MFFLYLLIFLYKQIRLTSTLSKLKRSFSSAFSKEDLSSENSTSKKAKENSKKGKYFLSLDSDHADLIQIWLACAY